MSSGRELRVGLTFSLRLTAWFALFLVIVSVGAYGIAFELVDEALEEEAPPFRSNQENEEIRERLDALFLRSFLLVAAPMILLALLGGAAMTYYLARPIRNVVRTVNDILTTGELGRRVPGGRHSKEMLNVVALFNRLLERNETLIRSIHESLDNVAHDIRNPVTHLRGTAERALEKFDDLDACREALSDTMEGSERLLAMLEVLMEVAEAHTGAMRLKREDTNLGDAIRDVVDMYGIVAEEKGAELEAKIEREITVKADPNRIRQVIANLTDNAIKYGGEGNRVVVALTEEAGDAVIRVSDRGRGIPADDLPKVFERLYRGKDTRSERGLGLGLSFVHAIVLAHGGKVDVESKEGVGTTFTVKIPGPGMRRQGAAGPGLGSGFQEDRPDEPTQ